MNKNKVFATLCLLAAIILGISSTSLTVLFFYSISPDTFGIILIGVAIALDFGKFAFPVLMTLCLHRSKYISVIVYGVLSLACIAVSFMASQSFDLNKNNEIKNETVTTSSAFERQTSLFKTTNTSVDQLRKDIQSLKDNKANEIKNSSENLRNQKNALPRDYITQRNNIQSKINTAESQARVNIERQIADKEKLLLTKEKDLGETNNGFDKVNKNISTTRGMYALAVWINKEDPDSVVGKVNMVKNMLIEIIAVAFALAFGELIRKVKIAKSFDTTAPNDTTETKKPIYTNSDSSNLVTANDTSKIIGFKIPDHSPTIDKSLVEKYRNHIVNTAKDGICRGTKPIAEDLSLDYETARKIRGILEKDGTIKTVGNKTLLKQNVRA